MTNTPLAEPSLDEANTPADGSADGISFAINGSASSQIIVALADVDLLTSIETSALGVSSFDSSGTSTFSATEPDVDGDPGSAFPAFAVMADSESGDVADDSLQSAGALSGTVNTQSSAVVFDGAAVIGSGEANPVAITVQNDALGSTPAAWLGSPAVTSTAAEAVVASVELVPQTFSTNNTSAPLMIAGGAVAEIVGISAQSVDFAGTSGTLKLDDALGFTGQVSGIAGSDALDLADVNYGANTTATFLGNATGGTLTVSDGTETANIDLAGNYLASSWDLSSDGNGGTTVVDPVSSNAWQTLDVGAGGFVDGLDIAPDGTMVARTDTYGAYIWNGTEWQQLVTSTSMPAAFVTPSSLLNDGQGVYEIQIAPSNSNILYMMYEGYVFESSNKGTTWTQTAFAPVTENPNGPYRMDGQKMAVDPDNPNIVYVGTPQNGLFATTNGGATWQSVSAVPVGQSDGSGNYPGITGIEFDPALGVTGGKTNTIFAASYGDGVYESTNAGASWSAIGGPGHVVYATVSSTGVYYATDGTTLWSYANSTWTQLVSEGNGIEAVAVDPSNPNEIVAQTPAGYLEVSYNGGATWSGIDWSSNQVGSTDISWLARGNTETGGAVYLSVGGLAFNPLVPNELVASAGTGVWTSNLPTDLVGGTPVIWNDQSAGIEQLVANEIIVPPGGDPVLASWDRPFFYISNANAYPSTYGPVASANIVAGWSVDYASSNPSFLVGLADWFGGSEESGFSTNGGQTWTAFPTFIPGAGTSFMGGTIAASSPTNIVWAPADGNQPYYTLNGGETWNPITLPGVSSWGSFDWAYYLDTRTVTADRVLPNTFYLYYGGVGVFETTNGGASWTEVHTGSVSPADTYNSEIQSVPGEAGNLFFTAGPQSGPQPDGIGFYRSTDQGATWSAVANVTDVSCFGYGAAAPGQSYPSIYIVGWVNNVYGVWQSINNAQSWTQIGTYPNSSLDQIKTISGDPNTYGQVYVGFQGSGYAYLPATSVGTGPVVSAIAASPSSGDLDAGHTVTLTLTMSETVTVAGGTPTLTLNDGGTAIYSGGSGTGTLTFSYTIGAGQNTSSLAVSTVSLNSATITDGAGNAASLSLTGATQTGPQIDTTAPAAPALANDIINANDSVTLTGTAEANSTVTVYDGQTALGTTATTGSGVWTYTTSTLAPGIQTLTATATDAAGNTSAASTALDPTIGPPAAPTIVSFSPDSGVVGDGITNATTVALAGTAVANSTIAVFDGSTELGTTTANGSGAWSYTTGTLTNGSHSFTATDAVAGNVSTASAALTVTIDTRPPTVASAVASGTGISSGAGDLDAGKTVTLTLNLSEAVTVSGGTPTLTLNDGGTATYSGGSGSNALTFSYTVGAGQSTPDLTVTAVNLNAATVTDGAGNAANLTGAVTNPAGILQIDTTTPTVASVVDSPASGDLNAGQTVTLTLNLSEAVTVSGGTPTLTLNDGGTATYTGGSGGNALTFSYTVAAGQNTSDLTVTAVNQNAATVTDGAGNAANLTGAVTNPAGTLQIDTTAPTVASVLASGTGISSGAGDLDAGKIVTLTLNLSEAVTVSGGTPTLTLNDGGTATYAGGSGTNALTFSYTVGAGQSTPDLTVTAVNLNAATVSDNAGNAANLTGAVTNPAGILQIDTTTPTVASVVDSPASGDLNAGQTVTLTLNLSEAVTVAGGTPTLTLNDGGTATYSGGSGSNALTFSYTVAAGQSTPDLTVTAVNLNAATVLDNAGNAANLTGAVTNPAGVLQIDTTTPTVASVVASGTGISSGAGDLDAGKIVTLTLNLSEAVTVSGSTPTLTLNDGGTATYSGGSGSNALTFSYTVAAGQSTSDLTVTAVNLNAATVTNGAGNAANLTGAVTNPAGILQIDTTTPTVSSLVASGTGISSGAGDLGAGNTVTLTLNLSEAVTVAGGTPTLTLNDGGTATYSGGSGSNALTFSYTVAAGQNTADLTVTAVNQNTATIIDGAGNAANLTGAVTNPAGTLQIDTTMPTVASVVASGTGISSGAGDLDAGKIVTLTLNLSEAVTVSGGTPTLTLNDGGTATYSGGSGSNALTFSYTVAAGQNTADLTVTAVNQNTATITDGAGNAANLTGAVTNPAGTLQIDTTAPTVSSLVASGSGITSGTGDVGSGSVVTLTLNLTEAVTVVGGTPTLTLNDGGTATYSGGSGSNVLTFSYTVAAGQSTPDLTVTAVNFNAATITDGAGNAANLTGAVTNPAGILQIDTTTSTVSSLVESPSSGDLNAGHTVTLTLNMGEAVTVAGGTPTLTLNDSGTATYTGGSGTNALTFSYTVAAGQNTSGLTATAVNLNAATVTDGAGNAANLSLTGLTQTGPQIDTTTPTVASVVASGTGISSGVGDLSTGSVVTLTLHLSEAVTVSGGTPTLTLNDGGTATYSGGSGSNALTFSYTVGAGQSTPDLMVTAVNLNAATITDGAGNAANLTGAVTNPAGILQIDTTTPTVSSLVASGTGISSGAGDLDAGKIVTLTLNLSEAVTVAGGIPTLTLNDGGTATYTGGSGSNALTFSYTVATGQNTADLTVTAVNLNAATVSDNAGNAANLTGAVTNPAGILQIDTTTPTVASVVASGTGISSGSGDLDAGKTVTLTLNLSEAVTVASGTPTLTLNDGGTATYTGGSGTNALTFSYTVATGQSTADLTVTAVNLNAATVTDGAGNAANLTGAVTNPAGILQIDTTTPTVASVVASGTGISSGAGDLDAGKTVTLTLNLSEAVTVSGGTPTLALDDGGTATYSGGSGSNALTFSYVVGAGQNTPDLTVTAVNLNAATVTDGAGNAVNLTGAVTNPAGILQIDTTTPTVASVVASGTGISSGAGDLDAGKIVTLTLNLSEAVTVAGGTPTLTLNDGGTATYAGGSGSNALTFSYTVAAGQNTPDLTVTAVNLNAATVTDGAGNAANLTGAVTNPAGTLQIDTTTSTVSSLVESPSSGDLNAGHIVTLTLNMGEAVTVAGGTPTLTLNDGGTATYTGGSGTNALTFSYAVAAGQNTSGLTATAVNLNAATVTDGAGNAANLSLTGLTQTGPQIDTTTPTVASVVDSPASGDLNAGQTVTLTLNLSEAVTVSGGTPTLTLNDGGTATYSGGSGSNALTFSYTVAAGQNTADLTVTAVNQNTATITDGAGNAANLTGAVTNPAGTLQIDTTAPTVSSLVASGSGITSGTGDVGSGSVVTLTLNLTEAVTVVGGTPTLTLNDGGTATYSGGSGSNALTFSYTVAAGQNTSDLTVTAVNQNAATVTDGAGNAANLTGAVTNPAGILQIDTTPPTVASLVASGTGISSGAGDLDAGKTVTLTLSLSEAVTVAGGTPTLTLNDGGVATYSGGSGSNALTFSYTVAAGQNTADLTVTAVNLNAATVTDGAGNAANLTGAVTNPAGILQIDTTTPTVASVVDSPASGDLNAGQTVTLTLNLSEAVTVSGGTPTLTLNDGGIATYSGGSGSNALTFSYTVGAGQSTPDLTVTAVNLNAATVTDGAGNAANLTLTGLTQTGPQIDTAVSTAPTIVSFSPDSGVVGDGITNATTLTLAGIAVAGSTVAVFDGSTELGTTTANGSGAWSFVAGTLANGSHSFTATDTVAGNVSTASAALTVTVDTVAPAAPTISSFSPDSGVVGDGITNATTLTLTGTAAANSTVEVFDGSSQHRSLLGGFLQGLTLLGTATANGSGAWSFTTSTLGNGSHSFTAKAVDAAGNVSTASAALTVTVDTVAPAAPFIANDTVNGNNSVTITGTAESNSKVTVYDGQTALGTTTANGSGAWSYTTGTLAAGIQVFTATATDAAGNTSTASNAVDPVINQSAAPTIVSFSPDSGVVGDGITNATTLTLAGIAVAGSTVAVFDGSTELGTTTANGSGAWSFVAGTLANGSHSFTATDTVAGNVSTASAALTVTVDTVAPAAPTISSFSPDSGVVGDGITNATTLTLTGTAAASSMVEVFDGSTELGTATTNGSGAWSFATSTLGNGSHSFTAKAVDAAGNVSTASAALTVTVDTIAPAAPTISSFSPDSGVVGDGITNATTLTLTGTAAASSMVEVFDGSTELGTATANGSGAWSFTTSTLGNGSHSFTAKAVDAAGNVSTASAALTVTVDTVAPAAPFIANDTVNGNNSVTITGTAESNSKVTVYDGQTALGTTTANGSGAWSYTTGTLAAGIQVFTATATDAAGNTSTASNAVDPVINQSAAPTIVSFSPDSGVVGDGITNATTLTLAGIAVAGSTVAVFDGSTELGTTTANGSGAWSFVAGTLANGSHSFTATDTVAGNVSTASAALTVTVDTVAPAAPTISSFSPDSGVVGDGITNATTLTLTGTAAASSMVEVFDGSTELGTATANGSGAWSFATSTLGNGSHSFTAKAVDAAGNVSTASAALTVTVDTIAPAAPTISSFSPDSGVVGDGITNATTLTLAGIAVASSMVEVFDGSTELGTATANGSGAWSFTTSTLGNGSHSFTAKAVDAAGNVSTASAALTVTVDTVAPAAPVIANDIVNGNNSVTLTGNAEANGTIEVFDGSTELGTATANGSGAWNYTTGMLAGNSSHSFTAKAIDAAGNVSTASAPMTVTTGSVPLSVPTAPLIVADTINGNTVTLTGTAAADDTVTVYDKHSLLGARVELGTTTSDANGSWTFVTGPLSNGAHTFYATVTNAAGTSAFSIGLDPIIGQTEVSSTSAATGPSLIMQPPGNAPAVIGDNTVLGVNTGDSGSVNFAGTTGTLLLDQPSTFTGTVSGFGAQNTIDLPGIAFDAQTTLGYLPNSNQAGGTLSVTDGSHSANIALLGNYIASSFAVLGDGQGGTMVAAEASQSASHSLLTNPQHA